MTEAEKERAAVVAWLRDPDAIIQVMCQWEDGVPADEIRDNRGVAFLVGGSFASAIERGDHLKGTGDE